MGLLVYRLLEKELDDKYTCNEMLSTIRNMQMTLLTKNSGYTPSYKRTQLTDHLHQKFRIHTDYEFISKSSMRKTIKDTK